MEKVSTTSQNIQNENLTKLKSVFPQFVKDGQVDFNALKVFFDNEKVLAGEEKYGLSWAGKSNAFRAIRTPATGTLTPQPAESKNWDTTENIFIEGDNLEVLKLLQKHYREKIKMIYIDPPYNTGKDFIYKDNFTQNVADYYEQTGQTKNGIKMTANTEKNGRFHSDWLTMMYPRLFLAHNLLKDDGVIFISIDDNEVHNLRMIMDEIFGEENFVANIVWERAFSPKNDSKYFSENHDYILVYSKKIEAFSLGKFSRSDEANARYKNPDNDSRGVWISGDLSVKTYSKKYDYPIKTPNGKLINPPHGSCWRVSKERFEELVNENRVWFGEDGNNVPRLKRFLSDVIDGMVPTTIWKHGDVGHNQEGRQELKTLFDDRGYFDGPKPIRLIKRILELSTENDDLMLDFFAGSGTTANAVIEFNSQNEGSRRKWISVQLPETTEEDSEAAKAGYKNIAQISRERIRRAGEKIGKGDVGFKAFALEKSNYRQWNVLTETDNEEILSKQVKLFAEKPLVDSFDEKSVVYEILEKEGFDLNAKVIQEKGPLKPWVVTEEDKKLVITFTSKVEQKDAEGLKLLENDIFVCFDSALNNTDKINISKSIVLKTL